jgi:hypothetical protein
MAAVSSSTPRPIYSGKNGYRWIGLLDAMRTSSLTMWKRRGFASFASARLRAFLLLLVVVFHAGTSFQEIG